MSNHTVLTQFLSNADTQIRIFDMGRRVCKLPLKEFQQFERGETPYPYPFQQTAWVGLLFWNKKNKLQHNIWFLRMPLDEIGHIQISSRDEFMNLLISRLQDHIHNKQSNEAALNHALKDNPYVFKPTQEKMAMFHAKASLILQQPASQYFQGALDYLQKKEFENWDNLGIQGIADLCARSTDKHIEKLLCASIAQLPEKPFSVFCQMLENEKCGVEISEAIIKRYHKDANNPVTAVNCIRAIACCNTKGFLPELISAVLNNTSINQDPQVLLAISSKAWQCLENGNIRQLFLESLANNQAGQDYFNALIMDLMFIPGMRAHLLSDFRKPERSENLSKAVGLFFQAISA